MKHPTTTMSESVQYKMDVTDLDHGRTRFYTTLIVLTIPATSTMPGVRPFNHPEFRQGRKTFCACWTCLYFDVPAWTVLSHPSLQNVVVILLICKDRDKTRKMIWVDLTQQEPAAAPSSRLAFVMRTTSNKPSVSTNRCRLRPLIFLPPSYPRSGPPISVVLTD